MDNSSYFAWIVAGIVGECILLMTTKKAKKSPCETCKWLNFKFCRGSGTYRYRCGVQGGDKPPLYCKNYKNYKRRDESGGTD